MRGWGNVLAAFAINFLGDGLIFSFGVLLIEFVNNFEQSRASTALIGSIMNGFAHLIGPVAGVVCDASGARGVVMVGALLCAVGVFASAYVNSVAALYLTFGVLGGSGIGLMITSASAHVMKHFTDNRSLASGIAACGSGVGTVVMNQLISYLIELYTWRGTVLIVSALLLNGVACGLFMSRPMKANGCKSQQRERRKSTPTVHRPDTTSSNAAIKLSTCINNNCQGASQQTRTTVYTMHESLSRNQIHPHTEKCILYDGVIGAGATIIQVKPKSELNDQTESAYMSKIDPEHKMKAGSNVHQVRSKHRIYLPILRKIKDAFEFTLLRDTRCICFMVSSAFVGLAFSMPFSFLPDQVAQYGMGEYKSTWLVSSIGISNTVCRVLLGILGDRKFVNRLFMLEIIMFLIGVSLAVSPLLVSFETKLIFTLSYGLFTGGWVMLVPVVLTDIFGHDTIGRAFGLNRCAEGFSALAGPALVGWIFDQSGSYTIAFLLAGAEFVAGGLTLLLPAMLKKLKVVETITKDVHV